jgi:predicted NBD/HSP70 family sugar kinase
MADSGAGRARAIQVRGMLDVLRHVHAHPSITRAGLARDLRLSRSTASEISGRLRALGLVAEAAPAPTGGRGRPTRTLGPHPDGPVVGAVDISHESWRLAIGSLGGDLSVLAGGPHRGRSADQLLAPVSAAIRAAVEQLGPRLRGVGIAVPASVSNGRLVQASSLGWRDVDVLDKLGLGTAVPVTVGNDATLAGLAEARRGAAVGASVALHIAVEVGIGGVLLDKGRPVVGSTGAGGEFGHLPFGDPAQRCPCGARGCWDVDADARALIRYAGRRPGRNPRTAAAAVLAQAALLAGRGRTGAPARAARTAVHARTAGPTDPASHPTAASQAAGAAALRAVQQVAGNLGRGLAGLVNALDPEVVTLSGLAVELLAVARPVVEDAYQAGLMRFRRRDPPPLLVAGFPADGSLRGAAELTFDRVLSDAGLDDWQAARTGQAPTEEDTR